MGSADGGEAGPPSSGEGGGGKEKSEARSVGRQEGWHGEGEPSEAREGGLELAEIAPEIAGDAAEIAGDAPEIAAAGAPEYAAA